MINNQGQSKVEGITCVEAVYHCGRFCFLSVYMHECIYGTHMYAGARGGQERALHLQEPELLVVASCHIDIGDGSQT